MGAKQTPAGNPSMIPNVGNATGPGDAGMLNTKRQFGPTPNQIGTDTGTPDTNVGTGMTVTSDHWPVVAGPNSENKGSGATEPDPATINRGYTAVTDANIPGVSQVVSGERLFGIDPGDVSLESPRARDDAMRSQQTGTGSTGD